MEQKINKKSLTETEIYNHLKSALLNYEIRNKDIIVIIPDNTRSGPHHIFVKFLIDILKPLVNKLDFLIALGTHPIMSQNEIFRFLKITEKEKNYYLKNVKIFNHLWKDKNIFKTIGSFSKEEIYNMTDGLFSEEVIIKINRIIFDYDIIMVLSPVFPHEVVGFSGGVKYFFPGISGWEFIDFFHWWAALLTNLKINGVIDTPIRNLMNKAAEFIKIPKILIALNLEGDNVYDIFIGDIYKEWRKAAEASARTHIVYEKRRYNKVLSIPLPIYTELWTAGKAMYKLESIVEDGGELIIYAPHIKEISPTHGKFIEKVGYHIKEYFLADMNKFKNIPRSVLAHCTHVKGIGEFKNNVEKPRIKVTLATSIDKNKCEKINLNYIDYKSIKVEEWLNKEEEGVKVIFNAGETLYKFQPES